MPVTYRIDVEAGLVRTFAHGVVTEAEVLEYQDKLAADPAFEASMGQLTDARGIERLDVTTNGIRQFVAHDARHAERFAGHRMAIVASEDVVFGMARMYQTMSDVNVGVFRSIEEALVFLGQADAER